MACCWWRIDIATLLRGLQLDLITRARKRLGVSSSSLQLSVGCLCNFSDSPSSRPQVRLISCDPIASVTDMVSADATGHRDTESHTFPAEGFRSTVFQKNRPLCCPYVGHQVFGSHDAWPVVSWHSKGRNRRAATPDDRGSKETSNIRALSVLQDPTVLLAQNLYI